jgi:hypothetical protein
MPEPYKSRVDVRRFLNFPGFHDGAYIVAYVEDTRPRRIDAARSRRSFPSDPVPGARTILEIADCGERINLEFSLHNELRVQNSLHKVDSLLHALTEFRAGLVEEAQLYAQRKASCEKRQASTKKRRSSRSR